MCSTVVYHPLGQSSIVLKNSNIFNQFLSGCPGWSYWGKHISVMKILWLYLAAQDQLTLKNTPWTLFLLWDWTLIGVFLRTFLSHTITVLFLIDLKLFHSLLLAVQVALIISRLLSFPAGFNFFLSHFTDEDSLTDDFNEQFISISYLFKTVS